MLEFFKRKSRKAESSKEVARQNESPSDDLNAPLVQGRHFYIENGNYVFTEYYLKNRGYCCGNRCRHCPYPDAESKDQ